MFRQGSPLAVFILLIGACAESPTTATTSPSITITAVTTTPPIVTSITATTTSFGTLPEAPLVTTGWSLQAGDFLVAGHAGVSVVRGGEVVSRPVMSPVESAFGDAGSIVFVTPDPDRFPDHWPTRGGGGGYLMWRAQPDGVVRVIARTGPIDFDRGAGKISLYQVPVIGLILSGTAPGAEFQATPIYVFDPEVSPDYVRLMPLGHDDGVGSGVGHSGPGEGGFTGVGWQESDQRLIVAVASDGGGWLEAWDFGGPSPRQWPSDWPTNPLPRGTPCRDDPSFNHCLDSVTTLPGTTLIAYTETDSRQVATELVVFDTETGTELQRLQVAVGPAFVKLLNGDAAQVVVSLMTWDGARYVHLPALVVDVATGHTVELPIPGVATVISGDIGNQD